MTRSRVLYFLYLILACGWVFAVTFMLAEHVAWQIFLAVVIPMILAIVVIRMQYIAVPKSGVAALAKLAQGIDQRRIDKAERFDDDIQNMPVEILPVVHALNRLLDFYSEKFSHERDFTASASHELRTPLAGIRLQTEIALRTKDDKQRELALKNIVKAVDRGTRLVEQLLALSRLNSEDTEFKREQFDLDRVVQEQINQLHDLAATRKTSICYEQGKPIYLTANVDSIGIMINNLLRNAIFHSPQESKIVVELEQDPNDIHILITDSGPGIPEQEREQVIQRFRKGSGGMKSGTGLGLAIVARILRLHDAVLRLDSPPDHRGLKVIVTLPLKSAVVKTMGHPD